MEDWKATTGPEGSEKFMDIAYARNPGPWKNNKILLLDPDEAIQMLYRDELGEEGYEVIPLTETGQVMQYIEIHQPSLMVMEAGLYGHNGLRLLQDIRNTYPELPVILCTADPSFKKAPTAHAADDVILKGMSVSELKQSVKNLLEFKTLVIAGRSSYTIGDRPT